jgi:glycosyltransferase involved in cell wall biosynthesis
MEPKEKPNQPLVSILLNVFNGEPYLAQQVDSILAQTYSNLELIICDDCSTDRTPEIAQEYVRKDTRVRWVRNERNMRVSATFQAHSHLCRGEFIAPSDADDIWLPEKIEKQVAFLMAHPKVDLVVTDLTVVNHDLSEKMGSFHEKIGNHSRGGLIPIDALLVRNLVGWHASCFRRALLPRLLPMPVFTWDAWLGLVGALNHPFGFIAEQLVLYRQHAANIVGSRQRGNTFYIKRLNDPEYLRIYLEGKSNEAIVYNRLLALGGSDSAEKALKQKAANQRYLLEAIQAANFGGFVSSMAKAAWVILKSDQKYHVKQWAFIALSWGAIRKLKLNSPTA